VESLWFILKAAKKPEEHKRGRKMGNANQGDAYDIE
jgi:hypothetical protein